MGAVPFLPSDREALLRACSACMGRGPRRVPSSIPTWVRCSSGLLLLTVQGPQIWILASHESLGTSGRNEVR